MGCDQFVINLINIANVIHTLKHTAIENGSRYSYVCLASFQHKPAGTASFLFSLLLYVRCFYAYAIKGV